MNLWLPGGKVRVRIVMEFGMDMFTLLNLKMDNHQEPIV